MNNNTKVRIYGSKALFESIAKEILAEAGGKSPAQKMTDKMMGKKKAVKIREEEMPTEAASEKSGIEGLEAVGQSGSDTKFKEDLFQTLLTFLKTRYPEQADTRYEWLFKGLYDIAETQPEED